MPTDHPVTRYYLLLPTKRARFTGQVSGYSLSDARNELNYTTVNLAGGNEFNFSGTNYAAAIAGDDNDNPRLTMTNSTVMNSESYAVFWEGGIINDILSASANNTFTGNAQIPDVVLP
ncbi:MAG: hypothetical protein U5L09_12420 [Bacteroidales bacterium]|nr:hypothetical protein [Bacteroidales bacterium]